eukprot:Skav210602  [mRNA]  locus=scaffold234:31140:35777:- [translate_table: standard]
MHEAQQVQGCRPILAAGFPCQPYSRQGSQRRSRDPRSRTLGDILKAAHLTCAAGLFLECVPEAMTDAEVQRQLHEFAEAHDMQVSQRIVHLHNVWPSRRTRWYAVVLPKCFGAIDLQDLPALTPAPKLSDLMPDSYWPFWSLDDEQELRWTDLECQAYRNPEYGSPQRHVQLDSPLPTALHSWGCALYPCPCGCRVQGLSPSTLKAGGLRGVAIRSNVWPYGDRHIHPKELQFLLGFAPFEKHVKSCRAQLCLYGNSASPIQVMWVWAHVLQACGLVSSDVTPIHVVRKYVQQIVKQRDVSWPSPTSGAGVLTLIQEDVGVEIRFNTSQTVSQLLFAEASLSLPGGHVGLMCEGWILPPDSFLQERTYTLVTFQHPLEFPTACVPLGIGCLGQWFWMTVPPTMTLQQVAQYLCVPSFHRLVDEHGQQLDPNQQVTGGQIMVIQQCADDVDLDLALMEGFGLEASHAPFGFLRITDSYISTGLWPFDQILRSQLLVTWSSLGFTALTVWLPSFSAAIVESWPGMLDEQVQAWLRQDQVRLFAFVREDWGWNVAHVWANNSTLVFRFIEPLGQLASLTRRLSSRVSQAGCDRFFHEVVVKKDLGESLGTLGSVLERFHHDLGICDVPIEAAVQLDQRTHALKQGLISPTVSMPTSVDDSSGFVGAVPRTNADRAGLTGSFMLSFGRAIVANSPHTIDPAQVQVVSLSAFGRILNSSHLAWSPDAPCPVFLFVLWQNHWSLVQCEVRESMLHLQQFDGLDKTPLMSLRTLAESMKSIWKFRAVHLSTTWIIEQTQPDSCGTVALGHFALRLNAISFEQAMHFEMWHISFAACSRMQGGIDEVGYGPSTEAVQESLKQLLPSKGVPEHALGDRVQAAIKTFGVEALDKALSSKHQWSSLKQLGNSRPRPFFWVTHQELQVHIQERSQNEFGAQADVRRSKPKKTQSTKPFVTKTLDPGSLLLPPDVFTTNQGEAVHQISVAEVVKNARGIAFGTAGDVAQFLADGKLISPEPLSILVIGAIPDSMPQGLPLGTVQAPAIYRGTNEPIIIECTAVQLGDQAIYRKQNKRAPEVAVHPTVVFRVHVYRDLWELDFNWDAFTSHPVKDLVSCFDVLRLCKDADCDCTCGKYHPSLEEEGVESGLLDIWGFNWHYLDGRKATPAKADALSIYFRTPESSFNTLHQLSGTHGVFFEPRESGKPGPDPKYAIVWTSGSGLGDVLHKVKTIDVGIAVCRLGSKYGIRCLTKDQEELHRSLNPNKPFVQCSVKMVFRLEPLPAGTQRQSLVELLQSVGWKARPLQSCKGSQGRAWTVGSETEPPTPFLETQEGWVSVSPVKDTTPVAKPRDLIATARTVQHMKATSTGAASSTTADPWQTNQSLDPWHKFQGVNVKPATAPQSQHVQKKFDDVEQKLTDKVQAALQQGDQSARDRLHSVESQLQAMKENQEKLEHWVVDGSAKIAGLQHENASLTQAVSQCHAVVQTQGTTIQQLSADVATCANTVASQGHTLQQVSNDMRGMERNITQQLHKQFETYFDRQQTALEAMLEKRQKTS